MSIKTIPIPENAIISIRAHADLVLQGWDKPEIRALSDSRRSVSVQNTGNNFSITCADDCDLTVPASAKVVVERIGGDSHVRDFKEALVIQKVGGDLVVQGTGSLEILSVGGDCCVCHLSGPLSIQRIGGDLTGADIQGFLSVSNVGGDVEMEVDAGDISMNVGGDVDFTLKSLSDQKVKINSSGDVTLHLPEPANADLSLVCGGEIEIAASGVEEEADHVYSGKLGAGGPRLNVRAGGDIKLTSEISSRMQKKLANLQEHWADLEEHRANIMEEAAEQEKSGFGFYREGPEVIINTDELSDRARREVERKMRHAQERMDAAMRRIEARTRKMMDFGAIPPIPPIPPAPPEATPNFSTRGPEAGPSPSANPEPSKVSNEERILILKMLQEKKITAEEAEHLLEALEG
jgi:hypothetical protein